MRTRRVVVFAAAVLCLSSSAWAEDERAAPKKAPPAKSGATKDAAKKTAVPLPKPPVAWLAPYANAKVSTRAFDEVRTRLFRSENDGDVVRGLLWLAHSKNVPIRSLAAKALTSVYLLGDHVGVDPAPAVRTLARDPEPRIRSAVIGALLLHDTPLARELVHAYATGAIAPLRGKSAKALGTRIAGWRRMYGTAAEFQAREDAGAEAVQAWIKASDVAPAGASSGRFHTGVITTGREDAIPIPDTTDAIFWIASVTTLYGEGAEVTSADSMWSWIASGNARPQSGRSGCTSTLYTGSLSGHGKASFEVHMRYLGKERVRYWIRVSKTGSSLKHTLRRRLGRKP
jgi:hypothetical protein